MENFNPSPTPNPTLTPTLPLPLTLFVFNRMRPLRSLTLTWKTSEDLLNILWDGIDKIVLEYNIIV